ncbi:MAG: phytanoyl-CoA dioxygenase family protein [Pseudomonadota bacterium]
MVEETKPAEDHDATNIDQPWRHDNQAWWDWYVSLADNEARREALIELEPLPQIALPSDAALADELRTPYPLSDVDRQFFAENGFVKLKAALSAGAVLKLRRELLQRLSDAFETRLDGGAQNRFLSLEMLWLDNPLIRAFVLSPRMAQIAADLLSTPRVRLYHDNVLSKEPGCGRTPWHYDDHHFPLATHDVVTAWIPAQPIPREMGPLAFAKPIDAYKLVEDFVFNKSDTSYDRSILEKFRAESVEIEDGPFEMGEVSFHHNLSFHTAEANRTRRSRIVLANTYYADGARILDNPTMVSGDWLKFIPGGRPGGLAASALNPICWPVDPDAK